MAIGGRIKYFRKLRKMTQKNLGTAVGFDENTADIRIAQYESGTRTPKSDLTRSLASVLDVSADALEVPEIDSTQGLMHTLFAVEDIYGLTVDGIDGEYVLHVNKNAGENAMNLYNGISEWYNAKRKLFMGEITKEEYDSWRYNYPLGKREENGRKPEFSKPQYTFEKQAEPQPESHPKIQQKPREKSPEVTAATRKVDDILAQLKANMDILKAAQNEDES